VKTGHSARSLDRDVRVNGSRLPPGIPVGQVSDLSVAFDASLVRVAVMPTLEPPESEHREGDPVDTEQRRTRGGDVEAGAAAGNDDDNGWHNGGHEHDRARRVVVHIDNNGPLTCRARCASCRSVWRW